MNENQKAAFVQAQAATALIEALGMMSENLQRLQRGESIAYSEKQFNELINRSGIDHNAVVSFFQQ